MTVKLQDGSSKIIILAGSTTYMKEASSTKDDYRNSNGKRTSNSDGSVTAQSVQSGNLPAMRVPTQGATQ